MTKSACNRVSGFDPATGICWRFNNPGDGRCKCPACTAEFEKRDGIAFGRCRSGRRWFWTTRAYRGELSDRYGWTETEETAVAAAMAAVLELRAAPLTRANMWQAIASGRLKELNEAKRAARPAPDTSDARPTEYLFAESQGYYDDGRSYYHVYAFPIVRKTTKRIYYRRACFEWLPEISAPDVSAFKRTFDDDIGFADREELERTGESKKHGGSWSSVLRDDYHLFLRPPQPPQTEPDLPDLAELKTAMAAAHPDRGGTSAAFIEARKAYEAALRHMRR